MIAGIALGGEHELLGKPMMSKETEFLVLKKANAKI